MTEQFFVLARQELLLTLIVFVLLFMKIAGDGMNNKMIFHWVNAFLLINFLVGLFPAPAGMLFNEMFVTGKLVVVEKNILNLGTLIISWQAYNWLQDHDHIIEFYLLLLCTLLGMFFMLSAGNLLMFYVGLELAGIPLAALAGFDLHKRLSSEAAMKYIISSAFSSGLLLFGISLLYGATGTLIFTKLPALLHGDTLQLFSLVLIVAGFGFKISIVPFHLWTADVYQGSPVTVTAYLSVISKGAAVLVFVPVLYTVLQPLAHAWYAIIYVLGVLTMLVGNLFALRQVNIKRLLAFSSIAQAGFMLVGISGTSQAGKASVIYFVLIYIFSNLGAFGVVNLVAACTGKENIADYAGLRRTNPLLAWVMAISVFSLAGIPPTAGFFGKFFLLMAGAGKGNYAFIIIAALNMVISLYYYLKLVRILFSHEEEQPVIPQLSVAVYPAIALVLCMTGVVVLGLAGPVYDYIFTMVG